MRFGYVRGRTLATMTDDASPIGDGMRDRWMCPERLRYRSVLQRRVGDTNVTCCTSIHDLHLRYPDLADSWMKIREQSFRIGPCLGIPCVIPLKSLPIAEVVFHGRDRENRNKHHRH